MLDLAAAMKADRFRYRPLAGPKSVAVLFDKQSLRTRMSFEAGIAELGGNPIIVDTQSTHFGRGESLADAGRVVSRYVSAIVMRTFGDDRLAELASDVRVPVVNALTDGYHPCQLLADLLTIRERLGGTQGRKLAYVGDAANNMAQLVPAGRRDRRHARPGGRAVRFRSRSRPWWRGRPRSPPGPADRSRCCATRPRRSTAST